MRDVNSVLLGVRDRSTCGSICGDMDTLLLAEVEEILLGEVWVHSVEG